MDRFDGTAARQLDLIDPVDLPRPGAGRRVLPQAKSPLRLLRRDVYAELERRRRRAQIHARHVLDRDAE